MSDLDWFIGAGLGLFIHWDHVSQQGIEISWPLVGESVPGCESFERSVSIEQYQSSAATFNPQRWDPAGIARLARQCGVRYAVLTVRNHDGYSLFRTQHSDLSIANSLYGEDIVTSFTAAFRAEGLRVGLYYSLSDWSHPDYPRFEESDKPYALTSYRRPSDESWSRYLGYLRGQITELLTNYGPIDVLWFDGEWERTEDEWRTGELRQLIRSLQPNTIVNDRLLGQGDFATPEQGLPTTSVEGPWEMCLTMNNGWGWRPKDTNYKSARRIAQYLAEVAGRGGNLLLNVSPTGDGSLPSVQVARLKELGAWIATHGESVIGVQPAPTSVSFYGPATHAGRRLYLHLVTRPVEHMAVRGIPVAHVRSVSLLGSEAELAFTTNIDQHVDQWAGEDALGELLVDVGEPTGALHDVVAIDFDLSLSE